MSRNIQAESCKNFEYDESGLGRMGYGCLVCLNYKGRGLGRLGDKERECLGDCPSFAYSAKLRKDEKLRLEKYLAQGKQIAEEKQDVPVQRTVLLLFPGLFDESRAPVDGYTYQSNE